MADAMHQHILKGLAFQTTYFSTEPFRTHQLWRLVSGLLGASGGRVEFQSFKQLMHLASLTRRSLIDFLSISNQTGMQIRRMVFAIYQLSTFWKLIFFECSSSYRYLGCHPGA
ncbi:hypothetical protein CEXT_189851 [Caerostris extrusa]|uniref:Uncharacterized protein n=1 Tax=Caerostris extrusa TaxID=172846 RepID=A0AAV4QPD6_CAEEX|nr:hypothetical protein CEXT_189851 [Caerostris extrusa]